MLIGCCSIFEVLAEVTRLCVMFLINDVKLVILIGGYKMRTVMGIFSKWPTTRALREFTLWYSSMLRWKTPI